MIKKIPSIQNLAVFQNFNWETVKDKDGNSLEFGKYNILYGRNYSGKTTLSRIFRAFETGRISDKYETPKFSLEFSDRSLLTEQGVIGHNHCIRVFNEDFVRDNLAFIIDPDKKITPFAVLGDDNTKIEAEIKAIQTELGERNEGEETGLYAKQKVQKTLASAAKKSYDDTFYELEAKKTNKAKYIKNETAKYNFVTYNITKINADIDEILDSSYSSISQDKKNVLEATIKESVKATIPSLAPIKIAFIQHCTEAQELLTRKIGASNKITELIHNSALNDWVRQGAALHDGTRDKCAFCNQTISVERWNEIHAHFDEESKKLTSDLNVLIEKIDFDKTRVSESFRVDKLLFYSKFQGEIDKLIQRYTDASKEYTASLEKIIAQLKLRRDTITQILSFLQPEDNTCILGKIFEEYEKLRTESNDYSSSLGKEQVKAREGLRLQEVYDFCQTIGYSDELTKIAELKEKSKEATDALNDISRVIAEKEIAIEDKKKMLNDEAAAAAKVNKYLSYSLGHKSLLLKADNEPDADGEKQVRFNIIRDDKVAYNLSEGECTLIAFCFFIAKLDDIGTKDKHRIIWIDDPISSLDNNNVFLIYSLLRAKIVASEYTAQLFISTHNIHFLKYLKRIDGRGDNNDSKKYFIVVRQNKISIISPMPDYMRKYVTEFNYLFNEILLCSESEPNDQNSGSFYNFGNNARKFLEIYLFYCYPDDSRDIDKMRKFFGEDAVPALLVDRIDNEYSHLAGGVERGAQVIDQAEIHEAAKLIMRKIEERDDDQYKSLIKSVRSDA